MICQKTLQHEVPLAMRGGGRFLQAHPLMFFSLPPPSSHLLTLSNSCHTHCLWCVGEVTVLHPGSLHNESRPLCKEAEAKVIRFVYKI